MDYYIETPASESEIRQLKIGDSVYISGTIITARDEAHRKALKLNEKREKLPIDFDGLGVFHCGPIMKMICGKWEVVAAGPTTSARMENFEDKFIEAFRPAIIIGKGGMGERTEIACAEYGCVYCVFTGGAALLSALGIKRVIDVFWLEELGMPECLWVFKVEDFGPLIVTIDSCGNNMTENVKRKVSTRMEEVLASLDD